MSGTPVGYADWCEGRGISAAHPHEWAPVDRRAYRRWRLGKFREHWRWLMQMGQPAIIRQQQGREALIRQVRAELAEALDPVPSQPWRLCRCHPHGFTRDRLTGAEAIPSEALAAWVAQDPFTRAGFDPRTQRALAYIESFAP